MTLALQIFFGILIAVWVSVGGWIVKKLFDSETIKWMFLTYIFVTITGVFAVILYEPAILPYLATGGSIYSDESPVSAIKIYMGGYLGSAMFYFIYVWKFQKQRELAMIWLAIALLVLVAIVAIHDYFGWLPNVFWWLDK